MGQYTETLGTGRGGVPVQKVSRKGYRKGVLVQEGGGDPVQEGVQEGSRKGLPVQEGGFLWGSWDSSWPGRGGGFLCRKEGSCGVLVVDRRDTTPDETSRAVATYGSSLLRPSINSLRVQLRSNFNMLRVERLIWCAVCKTWITSSETCCSSSLHTSWLLDSITIPLPVCMSTP